MNVGTVAEASALSRTADLSSPPCLIVNPLSFRNARGLGARAAAAARALGAEVVMADGLPALTAAVDSVLARRQRHLVVLAGDGTVQAVVDRLASQPPGAWLPDLMLLGGGRSNMTAADLVPSGDVVGTLERGLRLARDASWQPALVERALLRIEQAAAPPRHGFFVGGALVDTVIRATHVHRTEGSSARHVGHFSTPWFVLGLGLKALFGRASLPCPEMRIEAGRIGRLQGPTRLLLATTLAHRRGLFDPYADRGTGALRLTAVGRDAPRFRLRLPHLVSGRYTHAMDAAHGYLSGRAERVEVTGLASYCLDGEEFDCDPARTVVVTPVSRLRFLSLGRA